MFVSQSNLAAMQRTGFSRSCSKTDRSCFGPGLRRDVLDPLRERCNGCNERSAKARDFVDQKELFFEKDFSLLGDLADMQAVKRTK